MKLAPSAMVLSALMLPQLAAAMTVTFTNPNPITIPAVGTRDAAIPYPSEIAVSGIDGVVIDVDITLFELSHTFVDDISVLLVGPTGEDLYVWSDAGGNSDVTGIDVTFDDEASGPISNFGPLTEGIFTVSTFETPFSFPPPAPTTGYGGSLADFNGLDPNGLWSLFIADDGTDDVGEVAGGWAITFDVESEINAIPVAPSSALLALGLVAGFALRRR